MPPGGIVKESVGMEILTAKESKRALFRTRCLQRSSGEGKDTLELAASIKQSGILPGYTLIKYIFFSVL